MPRHYREHREPKCNLCNRERPDELCLGACYRCYMHMLEMQLRELPEYPGVLEIDDGKGTNVCSSCDVEWPADFIFEDSQERLKCVL